MGAHNPWVKQWGFIQNGRGYGHGHELRKALRNLNKVVWNFNVMTTFLRHFWRFSTIYGCLVTRCTLQDSQMGTNGLGMGTSFEMTWALDRVWA